jgi:hypothetical protein
MKHLVIVFFAAALVSCGSDKKENNVVKEQTGATSSGTGSSSDDGFVIPKIDTAMLKTVDDIVKAHAATIDARLADEKLKKENPNAKSHYIETMEVFNNVNEKRMSFGAQFKGQDYLDYNAKFKPAEDKLYGRTATK